MKKGKGVSKQSKAIAKSTNTIAPYLLRSGSVSEQSELSKSEETRSAPNLHNMASKDDASKKGKTDEIVTNNELKECLVKLITELEVKLTGRMDNIDKKLAEFTDSIEGLKSSVSKVEGEVEEVKSSVEFQGSEIDELKKTAVSKVDYEKMKDALSRRIEELEKQMLYNESRSRKYNLLFYGVPKEEEEDIVEVVRKLIVTELKFTQSYAKDVAIANAHRIPKNPENPRNSPDAVIVKFVCMEDRNAILYAARTRVKKGKLSVQTDLPAALKKKRSDLAKFAYTLRQDKEFQTQIRENSRDVWLMVREKKEDPWRKF